MTSSQGLAPQSTSRAMGPPVVPLAVASACKPECSTSRPPGQVPARPSHVDDALVAKHLALADRIGDAVGDVVEQLGATFAAATEVMEAIVHRATLSADASTEPFQKAFVEVAKPGLVPVAKAAVGLLPSGQADGLLLLLLALEHAGNRVGERLEALDLCRNLLPLAAAWTRA